MKRNRTLLPLLLVAGLVAAPAGIAATAPYQVAATAQQGMEWHKTDLQNGDDNHNGQVDSKDSIGVQVLGDNTNDGYDQNDSETRTFDTTFWVLLALVLIGVAGMAYYFFSRRQALSHPRV